MSIKINSITFISIFLTSILEVKSQTKEITLDWQNPTIYWGTQEKTAPCLEPFNLKVTDFSSPTSTVVVTGTVTVNETDGNRSNIKEGGVRQTIIASSQNGVITFKINPLMFHRYYVIHIELGGIGSKEDMVFSTALKSELSDYEFYAGAAAVTFAAKHENNIECSPGIATGLKIKLRPTSTNPVYDSPYSLYPHLSRISIVAGAVINDLSYKSTVIKPLLVGLKPLVGLDFQFAKRFGITVGAVFGNQDIQSALNSSQHIVAGLWLGLSFSSEVFQAFSNSVPATGLPKVGNSNAQSTK
jgi:hypothetical protein